MHMRALLLYPMIFGRRIHFFFYKQEAKMRPTKKQIILAASDSPRQIRRSEYRNMLSNSDICMREYRMREYRNMLSNSDICVRIA